MIYFTSDCHFSHKKILEYANRPFATIEEMNQTLIENWNSRIQETDEVYILGDFTLKGGMEANTILKQLKGRKYLVKGNHDCFFSSEKFRQDLLLEVYPYFELKYEKQLFVLFHYPITEWNGFYHNSIHLHGHLHSGKEYNQRNLDKNLRKYDVGVDANGMKPVSMDEILDFFRQLPEKEKDVAREERKHHE